MVRPEEAASVLPASRPLHKEELSALLNYSPTLSAQRPSVTRCPPMGSTPARFAQARDISFYSQHPAILQITLGLHGHGPQLWAEHQKSSSSKSSGGPLPGLWEHPKITAQRSFLLSWETVMLSAREWLSPNCQRRFPLDEKLHKGNLSLEFI